MFSFNFFMRNVLSRYFYKQNYMIEIGMIRKAIQLYAFSIIMVCDNMKTNGL